MDYSDFRVGELSMEEQNGITQYNVSETINRLYSVNIYSAKQKFKYKNGSVTHYSDIIT